MDVQAPFRSPKAAGGRSEGRERAPREDTDLPDGQTHGWWLGTLPLELPLWVDPQIDMLRLSWQLSACRIEWHQAPLRPHSSIVPFTSSPWGLIPSSLPSLQRQQRTSIRRPGPHINITLPEEPLLATGGKRDDVKGRSACIFIGARDGNHPAVGDDSPKHGPRMHHHNLQLSAWEKTASAGMGGVGERSPDLAER